MKSKLLFIPILLVLTLVVVNAAEGDFLGSFSTGINGNTRPYGIGVDSTYLYVSDEQHALIQKYWHNGTYTGINIDVSSELFDPYDIDVNNGILYVLSASQKNIYEYNTTTGAYVGFNFGVGLCVNDPVGVAVDDNYAYILATTSKTVCTIYKNGTMKSESSALVGANSPYGISVYGDNLIVADYSSFNRVYDKTLLHLYDLARDPENSDAIGLGSNGSIVWVGDDDDNVYVYEGFSPPSISVSNIEPDTNYNTGALVNFTASVSCNLGCKNSTFYLYNSSHDLKHSVFYDLTGLASANLGTTLNLSLYGGDGTYTWNYDVADTSILNAASSEWTINYNTDFPLIVWVTPSTDISLTQSMYNLSVRLYNTGLDTANLTVFNSSNDIIDFQAYYINNPQYNLTRQLTMPDGENTILICVNDSVNNQVCDDREITVDTLVPVLTLTSPIATTYTTTPILSYTYTEANCDSVWYSTDGGSTVSGRYTCGDFFSGLPVNEDSNTWVIYMNDTFGHSVSHSVTFIYHTPPEAPNFVGEIQGTGTIYKTLRSSAAGLALFLHYMTFALPNFILVLLLIGLVITIAYFIAKAVKININQGAI